MIEVVINGEPREVEEGISLEEILRRLGLEEKVMAAAINSEIVQKQSWSSTPLNEGDRLELLHFVGGG